MNSLNPCPCWGLSKLNWAVATLPARTGTTSSITSFFSYGLEWADQGNARGILKAERRRVSALRVQADTDTGSHKLQDYIMVMRDSLVGEFTNWTEAKPPWMVLEEKVMDALGGKREAQMDDTCRGKALSKQADLKVTNLTGPKPATLLL